jgi:hypothetical protein
MTAILAHGTDNRGRADIALSAPDGLQRAVSSTAATIEPSTKRRENLNRVAHQS